VPAQRIVCISGASSGLGHALAARLAGRGDLVFGGLRDPADAARLPPGVIPLALDVTDPEAAQRAVAGIADAHGRLDLLVSNAGIGASGPWELLPEAELRRLFDVNFFGAVRLVTAALPLMRRQGGGRLLVVSSLSGLVPRPTDGAYSASKHALEAFAESLAYEVRRFGIRVTLVNPGGYATAFASRTWQAHAPATSPYAPLVEHLTAPSGTGSVEEAAAALAALADDPDPPLRAPIDATGRRVYAVLGLDAPDAREALQRSASGLGWWIDGAAGPGDDPSRRP
jgi:NAD(P)-dependent dehydrogenase (short-subunit alcohol dehydrogenase family)